MKHLATKNFNNNEIIRDFLCLYNAKNINEVIEIYPKYLFKYKTRFLSIFEKTNTKKIASALALIKKTELLLRKHASMHQAISQRFLLNLKNLLDDYFLSLFMISSN